MSGAADGVTGRAGDGGGGWAARSGGGRPAKGAAGRAVETAGAGAADRVTGRAADGEAGEMGDGGRVGAAEGAAAVERDARLVLQGAGCLLALFFGTGRRRVLGRNRPATRNMRIQNPARCWSPVKVACFSFRPTRYLWEEQMHQSRQPHEVKAADNVRGLCKADHAQGAPDRKPVA